MKDEEQIERKQALRKFKGALREQKKINLKNAKHLAEKDDIISNLTKDMETAQESTPAMFKSQKKEKDENTEETENKEDEGKEKNDIIKRFIESTIQKDNSYRNLNYGSTMVTP